MRRGGPVLLHFQLFQILRARVASGVYALGSQLPTDEALMQEFRFGRHTVRSALQELVSAGLIERFPGRGSFVLRRQPPPRQWSIGSVEDVIDLSFVHAYTILDAAAVPGSTDREMAGILGLDVRDAVFRVRAVRPSRGGAYAYSYVWFPADAGQKLPVEIFDKRPLILLIEEYCGLSAFTVKRVASAEAADDEVAPFLDVRPGQTLLVLERTHPRPGLCNRAGGAAGAVRRRAAGARDVRRRADPGGGDDGAPPLPGAPGAHRRSDIHGRAGPRRRRRRPALALSRAPGRPSALVPVEAVAVASFAMMRRDGVVTIPVTGMPGAACVFRLMMFPGAGRLGDARLLASTRDALDRLVTVLGDAAGVRAMILGTT